MTSSAAARVDLIRIFTAATRAVDPYRLVRDYLTGGKLPDEGAGIAVRPPFLVVGAGKAAARMAAGCEAALGSDRVRGLVITADGCTTALDTIQCVAAGHPVPDERGLAATARLASLMSTAVEPVIALISGGASALLVQPAAPITLAEKTAVNELLLRCGATIDEVNAVRKHVSLVKGGGLLRRCPSRPLLTLVLSDVVGDDPSVIGSGPTVPDPTTYRDAMAVLRRYRLDGLVPAKVRHRLEEGEGGLIEETIKPGTRAAQGAYAEVLGNNRTALAAAATEAECLGYRTIVIDRPVVGNTLQAARAWHGEINRLTASLADPWCVLSGGETTVEVKGTGRGGRNQEFALALVDVLEGTSTYVLSAGTDGIDGPTDAAGAFVNGGTAVRARRQELDPAASLQSNDSYGFFANLDDLYRCGPTGTNVMDIKIAISRDPD
jgi:hydroxypyruvate reductase